MPTVELVVASTINLGIDGVGAVFLGLDIFSCIDRVLLRESLQLVERTILCNVTMESSPTV